MRKYEIMFIIRPNVENTERAGIIEKFKNIITNGGSEIVEVNEWGTRDLAYEINDFKKGYYVVLNVKANDETINEFNRVALISEDIIRYIVIKDEK